MTTYSGWSTWGLTIAAKWLARAIVLTSPIFNPFFNTCVASRALRRPRQSRSQNQSLSPRP
eukprot:5304677-Pyramimonas_sp.AAC.1